MLEINKHTIKMFNDANTRLFRGIRFPKQPLTLNGSYPHTLWAADIDLYQPLTGVQPDKLGDFLVRVIANITPPLYFQRLKIGNKEYKTTPKAIRTLAKGFTLKDTYNTKWGRYWVKIDLIMDTHGYIEEISMIYDISPPGQEDTGLNVIRQRLQDDAQMYYEDGRYFKTLRRHAGSATQRLQANIRSHLQDADVGFLYLTLTRLRTLQQSTHIPLATRKRVLSNLKQDLALRYGIGEDTRWTIKNIPKLINQGQTILNKKLRPYITKYRHLLG